jgi:hypothetical protein
MQRGVLQRQGWRGLAGRIGRARAPPLPPPPGGWEVEGGVLHEGVYAARVRVPRLRFLGLSPPLLPAPLPRPLLPLLLPLPLLATLLPPLLPLGPSVHALCRGRGGAGGRQQVLEGKVCVVCGREGAPLPLRL